MEDFDVCDIFIGDELEGYKQWRDDYGLEYEHNYSVSTEIDCQFAFKAGVDFGLKLAGIVVD